MNKKDPLIVKIKEKVDSMYAGGRTTAMSDYELKEIIKEIDIDSYHKLKYTNGCDNNEVKD